MSIQGHQPLEEGRQPEATRLLLYGQESVVVTFEREVVKTYWAGALSRGERFINFNALWVRTDLIYAIEGVR